MVANMLVGGKDVFKMCSETFLFLETELGR